MVKKIIVLTELKLTCSQVSIVVEFSIRANQASIIGS